MWANSRHDILLCGQNSPHEKCEENVWCGEIMSTIYNVLSHFMLFCYKIVIYAVLSRYLFCLFCMEKNSAKNCARGEKMTNIRYGPCLERDKETLNQKKMVFDNPWHPPTSQRHSGRGVTWIYKLGMRWYNLYHKSESGNEKWKWGQ